MADVLTLTDLLGAPTSAEIETKLLSALQGDGFPITDWESGGVERTIVEMETLALTDLVASGIPAIVGGGFLGYATGDWLTFLAAQLYDLTRRGASFTQQAETLTCAGGAGPIVLNAGELQFKSDAGLIYFGPMVTDTDPGPTWTVPDGGSLVVTIQSEHPNDSGAGLNYIDPAGTITTLVTQVAGLTCDNAAPVFSSVGLTGTGSGTITPSKTNVLITPDPHAFDVVVVAAGDVGVGTYKYRTDGGSFSAVAAIPASLDLPGGTTITFANGAGTPDSFIPGDVYNFATPGSPITFQGSDEESDGSLVVRCQARWPDLADIPTEDRFATWAKKASPQVTRVRLVIDAVVPGQVNLILFGQAGPVSPAVVNTVDSYVVARQGIGFLSTTASAVALPVVALGTVYAPASKIAAAQAAAQLAWTTYIASCDTQVLIAEFVTILVNAGCSNVVLSSLRLNGVNGDVSVGSTQVATFGQVLSQVLTWIAVAG